MAISINHRRNYRHEEAKAVSAAKKTKARNEITMAKKKASHEN